jgi:hypothetical protein
MKKFILNLFILALILVTCWGFFKLVNTASTPHIVNNHSFEYKTYSLFEMENNLFRINHKTGEIHYFSQGMFVPVPALTSEQLQELMRRPYQGQQGSAQQLLEQLD